MKRLRPSFLGLGLCLLATGLTGCKSPEPPWFSDLDRAKSFETFAAKNAEAWHNGSSLKRRTAVLIQGIHMTPVETMGSTLAMDFVAEQSCTVWCGHAVAIATDGYFLTSAHCADSTILSLVYWDGPNHCVERTGGSLHARLILETVSRCLLSLTQAFG
jgi:hypothetical protein